MQVGATVNCAIPEHNDDIILHNYDVILYNDDVISHNPFNSISSGTHNKYTYCCWRPSLILGAPREASDCGADCLHS